MPKEAGVCNGEKTVSSTSSAGKTRQLHVKEHKNKFKSIKDLNVRLESIKLLKENLGRTLFDMNIYEYIYDSVS